MFAGGSSIKVRVKFFGAYRRMAGEEEVIMELEPQCTLSLLLEKIKDRYELGPMTEDMVVSVNGENVDGDTVLEDGDQVAVLPTVTGG